MSRTASTVTVLALLPYREDQLLMSEIFAHSNWDVHFAETLGQARVLIEELAVGVVISDSRLADGRWQDVLGELRRQPVEPPLIVASRLADDRLWAEVLNLGGYDVLTMPFQAQEVLRSVSLAWRQWRDKLLACARPAAKVTAAGSGGGLRLAC